MEFTGSGVMCSDLLAEYTGSAAELTTDCSRRINEPGRPASTTTAVVEFADHQCPYQCQQCITCQRAPYVLISMVNIQVNSEVK